MHLHYLTLQKQTEHLQKISGCSISGTYTQRKNEWTLSLQKDGQEAGCLQLCCDSQFPYILHLENARRGKNSTDVMEAIAGKRIVGIGLLPGERIIEIEFSDWEQRLLLQFFTARTNFFLVNNDGKITNAFKQAKKYIGETFDLPITKTFLNISQINFEAFLAKTREDANLPIEKFLKQFQYLTRPIIEEILYRSDIKTKTGCGSLPGEKIREMHEISRKLLTEIEDAQPVIYYQSGLPEKFSLFAMKRMEDRDAEVIENINSALRIFNFQSLKNRGLIQRKTQYERVLQRKIKSLKYALGGLEKKKFDPEKKEMYQKIGQLIISQPHLLTEGQSTVELIDYYHPEMLTIRATVKPELSAKENAESYFRKARQYDERVREYALRKSNLQAQVEKLTGMKDQLIESDSFKKIKQIENTLKSSHLLAHRAEERAVYRLPYKEYEKDGFLIWVGRSAKDNDALTFEHANRDDLWLHVQGYAGSHVVIRNPNKKEHFPKPVLEYAARLAVTFSAAKHASYVPVIYTRIKYVRKPRKSAPGAVLPSQVKTIFADPLK